MTRRDIERYVQSRTGVTVPAERDGIIADVRRYRNDAVDPDFYRPTAFTPSPFLPPGTWSIDTTTATVATTNRTVARYLGQAPYDMNAVTLRFNVITAAATITWAEVGIGTSVDYIMAGTAEEIRTEGFVNVATTFNSAGIKDTEVAANIARGQHCWALWGSQATTLFNVLRALGDGISMGLVQFSDATRPSTMADPTVFTVSSASGNAAWIGVFW